MKTRLLLKLLIATIGAFIGLAMFSIQPNVRAVVGDGDLDPSFGSVGKVVIDFYGYDDSAYAVEVMADGKILVAGVTETGTSQDFALVQLNRDGSRDRDFGDNGQVITDFAGGDDQAFGIAVQRDRKIIVSGNITYTDSTPYFALARYNRDGTLDTTFGSAGTGKVVTSFTGVGVDVVLQKDDKILMTGFTLSPDFAVLRFNSDGSLDPSFGTGGLATSGLPNGNEAGVGIALQRDGKIVVGGVARYSASVDAAVARFNPDGSPDATFGTGGIVTTDFNGFVDIVYEVAIQRDGKIVLAGTASRCVGPSSFLWWGGAGCTEYAVLRYNSDGNLDTSFDGDGKALLDFDGSPYSNDGAVSVEIQWDGKIVVAGTATNGIGAPGDFGLARFNRDGSLDPSFGLGGKVLTDFFGGQDDAFRLKLQLNGKAVVVGSASNGSNTDFAIVRYNMN